MIDGLFTLLYPRSPVSSGGGLAPPDMENGLTPGTISGAFDVTDSGQASYVIPLDVPPGRAGMQPSLALSYSSGTGDGGPVGRGWSLDGLSQIVRCGRTASTDGQVRGVTFVDSPTGDNYCLDGELLRVAGGSTGGDLNLLPERTLATVILHPKQGPSGPTTEPEYFEVTRKDGRTFRYGKIVTVHRTAFRANELDDEEGDDENLLSAPKSYAWLLTEVRDMAGNRMAISYVEPSGSPPPEGGPFLPTGEAVRFFTYAVLPLAIDYTFASNVSEARRHIKFGYRQRPDPIDTWVSGALVRSADRLVAIEIWAPNNAGESVALRTYHLDYMTLTAPGPGLSAPIPLMEVLKQVQECTGKALERSGAVCRKPTSFKWEEPSLHYTELPPSPIVEARNLLPADIDGDGDDDLLWRHHINPQDEYIVWRNDGVGGFHFAGKVGPFTHVSDALVNDDGVLDANGDGLPDLAYRSDATHWIIRSFTRRSCTPTPSRPV
jgi:hypothetical protein